MRLEIAPRRKSKMQMGRQEGTPLVSAIGPLPCFGHCQVLMQQYIRCGSTKHTLSKCKKPSDLSNPLPFASCFVCSGQGHLASACPQNKGKGVYPHGGCCKICGDTSHLAKDCELRKKGRHLLHDLGSWQLTFHLLDLTHNPSVFVVDKDVGVGADEDGFHVFKRKHYEVEQDEKAARRQAVSQNPPVRKKKVVHF